MKDILLELLDSIVVCNDNIKDYFLKKIFQEKKLLNIKFKSFATFKEEVLGSYNLLSKLDLRNNEKIGYDLVDIKLNYSIFDFQKSKSDKINNLLRIKNKYQNSNYYNKSDILYSLYKNKKVIIVNKDNKDDTLNYAIDKVKQIAKVEIKEIGKIGKPNIKIFEYDSIKDEVFALGHEIAKKLYNNYSYEKIKVHLPNQEYYPIIKEVFGLYNIDTNLEKPISLSEYEYTKVFLKKIENYLSENVYLAFSKVLDECNYILPNEEFKKTFLNLLNKYTEYNLKVSDILEHLRYQLSKTKLNNKKYQNVLAFVNIFEEVIEEDDLVYLIGFNQDVLPKIFRDDEYLTDVEKKEIGLLTSTEKNIFEKEKLLKTLEKCNNVYISYSLSSINTTLVRSAFLSEISERFSAIEEKGKKINYNVSYSKKISDNLINKEIDEKQKYSQTNFEVEGIRKFDYRFKGHIPYQEKISNDLYLSYTSIDSYYKCPFKFFVERVLKVNSLPNKEAILIGNLFHYCFEKLLESNDIENVDNFINNSINEFFEKEDIEMNGKIKVFSDIYKDILVKNYEFLKIQKENTAFETSSLEKEYKIVIDKGLNVILKGKIDKVLTLEKDNKKYAVVIDYKTGSSKFTFDNVFYGLNMQLLFYYLFLRSEEDINFGGAYLTSVLPTNPFLHVDGKTYDEQLREYLLLNGYSNQDLNIISKIDNRIGTKDSFIKGIKFKNDGSYYSTSLSKVLEEKEFEKVLDVAKRKINEAIDSILKGEFKIEPKLIGKENTCDFCPYKEICYMKNDALKELEEITNLSFIRGDSNE